MTTLASGCLLYALHRVTRHEPLTAQLARAPREESHAREPPVHGYREGAVFVGPVALFSGPGLTSDGVVVGVVFGDRGDDVDAAAA